MVNLRLCLKGLLYFVKPEEALWHFALTSEVNQANDILYSPITQYIP